MKPASISTAAAPSVRPASAPLPGGLPAQLLEAARYFLASAGALAIDFAVYVGLVQLGMSYLVAAPVGFAAGLAAVYLISTRWVFRERRFADSSMEFLLFALIGIAGLLLNEAVIYAATDGMGVPYWLSKFLSAGIVFVFNFGLRKALLFTTSRGATHAEV
jgi:putative flippase GtrA